MDGAILEGFRLSPQQRRVWRLQQADQSSTYGATCAILIRGNLEHRVVMEALELVVRRHEILRTAFVRLPGMTVPLQIISDGGMPVVSHHDLTKLDSSAQEAAVEELFNGLKEVRCDFDHAQLLHVSLVVLSPVRTLLLLSLPALCADSATLTNLFCEIGHCYAARRDGGSLPDVGAQYADIAERQNGLIEGAPEEGRRYWQSQIANIGPVKLPFETELSRASRFTPRELLLTIDERLSAMIETTARKYEVSLPVFFEACWRILIWSLTKPAEIVIANAFDGRKDDGLAGALGLFRSYLPIRTRFSPGSQFSEAVKRTDETIREAYQWQDCFTSDDLAKRDAVHGLFFFPFCFDFEDWDVTYEDEEFVASIYKQYTCTERFKVKLCCARGAASVVAEFHYDSELFHHEDVEWLAARFHALLQAVTDNPQVSLAELELLSEIEPRRRVTAKTTSVDPDAIEAALLRHPSVNDCAVLARKAANSEAQLVAYVVPAAALSAEQLDAHLTTVLSSSIRPSAYVLVSNLPLNAAGQVDEESLKRLEVLDSDLMRRWQERLKSYPEIDSVAVTVQEHSEPLAFLHLSDLLSTWRRNSTAGSVRHAPTADPLTPRQKPSSRASAISHGAALEHDKDAPKSLGEVLAQAARQSEDKGIVYIESDNSETFQSYRALLEEAACILGGLRNLGLKPHAEIVFQLARNRDFIPAFWACVLGGFVPVPISVPPTYREPNNTLSKLSSVWKLLGAPVILSDQSLPSEIRRVSGDFQVVSIEDMRAAQIEEDWHRSQPEDLAVLLLTSGSTGAPKLVMLTHAGILSNTSAAIETNGFTDRDVSLNWMPLDHVGSLVRCLIRDVRLGCRQLHAPTENVLREPLKWLDWIERYKLTITWAPNFAFGLINERAGVIAQRRWDLSSMRFLLNTGEPIVARTAKRFLDLLAPHGLSPASMHSAWGMSETCSGVTFSNCYLSHEAAFVEVGPPVRGVSLRIVDDRDQVVEEGAVGRLQVKGQPVTPGYYRNREVNQEAFTSDGWFRTGDLAFLDGGRLTITGREKDVVIINGINYFCHEIESVIEEIAGVESSFTAACGIRDGSSPTEKLIIFFKAASAEKEPLRDLLKVIRGKVSQNFGISPDYLIPVEREEIPKTAIGKIQRAELSRRFEQGAFEARLKELDLLSGNDYTVPDWFYRKVWRPREAAPKSLVSVDNPCLVFLDSLGLGEAICRDLQKNRTDCVTVRRGSEFGRMGPQSYWVEPGNPRHYELLLDSLGRDGIHVGHVLHLWNYDLYHDLSGAEDLEDALNLGAYSLLFLVQAIAGIQGASHSINALVVSSHAQPVLVDDEIACGKSPMLGLIKTLAREMPWLDCRHVDLPVGRCDVNAARVLRELRAIGRERDVAYRSGVRLVPRLQRVSFTENVCQELRLKRGGMYLVSGGLGGIGIELARHLLTEYQARLLLLGRTALPERERWEESLEKTNATAKRIRDLLSLAHAGGEVLYEAVDICDVSQLRGAVEHARARWQCELDGVIHLAGVVAERLLIDETRASFAATLRAKIFGTWALHQLAKDQPHCLFISFSSVNGFFGGATLGAYAAANSFLDCFSAYQRKKDSLPSYSFAWSMWDDIGMARDYRMKELTRSRGHELIAPEQGWNSLLAALSYDQPDLVIGINGGNPHIRQHVEASPQPIQKLRAYVVLRDGRASTGPLYGAEVPDGFGSKSACELFAIDKMPVTANGEIDGEKLLTTSGSIGVKSAPRVEPRNDLERQIAEIWQEVLGTTRTGIYDNFFELGGHSVLAIQLISRLGEALKLRLPLRSLFETPNVAGLATAVERCKEDSGTSAAPDVDLPALLHDPDRRFLPFPLTDIQQAYWAGRSGLFALGNVATHMYLEIESIGLDLERFGRAWRRLIQRHEMLRAIVLPDGQQQVLENVPPYRIEVLDLHANDHRQLLSELEAVRQRMSHQVLPADRWPLFELRASRMSGDRVRLHVSTDALIRDALSWQILVRELAEIYRKPETILPPLEISFRDYVLAERTVRDSQLYRRSLEYWTSRFSDLPLGPELPLAKDPASVKSPRFVRRRATLEPRAWSRLKATAQRAGLTPSVVLLAAFAEVLRVWSKSARFTLNLTLFNRLPLHPQVNSLVGDFTSVTLLEVKDSAATSFAARARHLQEQLWRDLDHRYVSGVSVVRELMTRRGIEPGALMPVVFTSTLNQTATDAYPSSLSYFGEVIYAITQTPQVWLDHQVTEQMGALVFNWDAVEELFPGGMLDDMFGSYCRLVHELADHEGSWQENPAQTARKIVPPDHLQQYAAANSTAEPLANELLHTLFAKQVAKRPQQIAIAAADRNLTYAELYQRANRVGYMLRECGSKPNSLIAIVMDKTWEQVVAALGILASGAAYLPVDPTLPQERLRHALEHGEVKIALTQTSFVRQLSWPDGVRVLTLNEAECGAEPPRLTPVQRPQDLAYVIYTSGSTGLPKGVMIDHRAAVNTVLDINRRFGIGPSDRVLALSSLSFDLSVYDLFGTLAAGGTIVIPDACVKGDPAQLAELAGREKITVWNSVPALMGLLMDYLAARPDLVPLTLRLVLLSGDWIPLNLPQRIKAYNPNVRVISLGGATEASIWSIAYPVEVIDPSWKSIPYGRPLANQTFHVLNGALESCPVWVPGQLYIGGMGLARGYWRDSARTRASFISHPRTGERLYRTGDLGRYLPDGSIEFLGRDDFQVKVQGYRVDLGEIEAALLQHSAVRAAVVTASGELHGNKHLLAYVVPESGRTLRSAELRRFLKKKIADYMIPSDFMILQKLPLTSNGKVDRKALPPPRKEVSPQTCALLPSGTGDSAARIGKIIAGVMKRDAIDAQTNLLEMGANSIDIVTIVNLLDKQLGFRPKLSEFYQAPTLGFLVASYNECLGHDHQQSNGASRGYDAASLVSSFELLVDPAEREAFKKRQPGVRRVQEGARYVQLVEGNGKEELQRTVSMRRSHRTFSPQVIGLDQFSRLLSRLRQGSTAGQPKYLYASAGGLYPVQSYFYIKPGRVAEVSSGIYYYHPVDHRLIRLSFGDGIDRDLYHWLINGPIFDQAAFAVFLIAQIGAIAPMYGERSLHFATLEAGLIAQLLECAAPQCGIGLCQIGNMEFEPVRDLFALDESHVFIHSLLGGGLDQGQETGWTVFQEGYFTTSSGCGEREEGKI